MGLGLVSGTCLKHECERFRFWFHLSPNRSPSSNISDHADERIHRYVSGKQKLIRLLEEEKQAVINRAVTRGLDPNVRLKCSGVEGLGDVPAHWEVRRLRTVAEMRVSNVDKHTKEDEFPVRSAIMSMSIKTTVSRRKCPL